MRRFEKKPRPPDGKLPFVVLVRRPLGSALAGADVREGVSFERVDLDIGNSRERI